MESPDIIVCMCFNCSSGLDNGDLIPTKIKRSQIDMRFGLRLLICDLEIFLLENLIHPSRSCNAYHLLIFRSYFQSTATAFKIPEIPSFCQSEDRMLLIDQSILTLTEQVSNKIVKLSAAGTSWMAAKLFN